MELCFWVKVYALSDFQDTIAAALQTCQTVIRPEIIGRLRKRGIGQMQREDLIPISANGSWFGSIKSNHAIDLE